MTFSIFTDLVRQLYELRRLLCLPLIIGFRKAIPEPLRTGRFRVTRRLSSVLFTGERVVLLQLNNGKDVREKFCDYIVKARGTSLKERSLKDPFWSCIAGFQRGSYECSQMD